MTTWPFEETLLGVVRHFEPDTRWAIACGSALRLHGLPYSPSDIDCFSDTAGAARLAAALRSLESAFPYERRTSELYDSSWGRFRFHGVEVDVVGDFTVRRGRFGFSADADHPCWSRLVFVDVQGFQVPVLSLEDLLLLYLAIPDETAKILLLRHALRARGWDAAYLEGRADPMLLAAAGATDLLPG